MAGLSGLRLDLRRGDGFDTIGLLEWAGLAPVGRVKGVMRIAEGRCESTVREDLHIETLSVAPPDSRIELISANEADWNALRPRC